MSDVIVLVKPNTATRSNHPAGHRHTHRLILTFYIVHDLYVTNFFMICIHIVSISRWYEKMSGCVYTETTGLYDALLLQ